MSMTEGVLDFSYTQDRELSWLRFNERVLEEADDVSVPLYERLKFAAIFTSNLDEFFMIRVGSLQDLSLLKETHIDNKSGLTPDGQIKEILKVVPPLYKRRDRIVAELESQLRQYDIYHLGIHELEKSERKFIEDTFAHYVSPVISPQIIDAHHPFPHLVNNSLNIAVTLQEKSGSKKGGLLYGLIPIPQSLPRLVFLPGSAVRYVLAEQILLEYADQVFDMYEVAEKAVVRVSRNADINPDDESYDVEEDYRRHMRKILKKRARLAPVRLEVQKRHGETEGGKQSERLAKYLAERLNLDKDAVFKSTCPLDLSYVYALDEKLSTSARRSIAYPPFSPCPPAHVAVAPRGGAGEPMVRQILRKDILCSYPYEQMDPFLRLIKEAAGDPNVISIKITVYRLARKAKLIDHLIAAAENGKDVTVLMELRARFDEENNINWAEELEEAGCKVIYGFEGFKVHSKICLITRREKNKIQYITQVGTGNYNEKTAKLYTDLSLMTSSPEIGNDAAEFFKNMAISNLEGKYQELMVAPTGLKPGLMALIEGEIDKARNGRGGNIRLKMNSLTDRDLIDKLAEASRAGVQVDMVVRGICCLLPGIPGRTENIQVRSIVGRYLEHARIYCFGTGGEMEMYISSADWMTRNTERRVEVACPVRDSRARERIFEMLSIQMQDTVKARIMDRYGIYHPLHSEGERVNCQEEFMRLAEKAEPPVAHGRTGGGISEKAHKLLGRFSRKKHD